MEKELLVDEMRKQWGLPGLSMAIVKDGKIVDHFDIDKNDLSKEEDFNAWVDKYELNKDIDYSKETK